MKNVSSSCSENVEKQERLLIAVTAFLIFKQFKYTIHRYIQYTCVLTKLFSFKSLSFIPSWLSKGFCEIL
jgi:hypothetical protein